MTTGSNWFEDPAVLAAEVKRARPARTATPEIRGYDNLVELARGGQGVVFRAVQRSTRRAVAIKVLLDGALASGVAHRRFEREIDLVASLRHPSIVSVYDSGTTDDGRLYLVMELVEGVPLDQRWPGIHSGKAPLRDALSLMAAVADAVQYAHQRGVIHRDLKPSNIRVDSTGAPHILDFGLAKVSEGQTGAAFATMDRATLSTSGQFMGSLPWASPEQATGSPDAIDARTDVYALGVVLHQLITGKFPYDVTGGLKTTLDNITGAAPSRVDRLRPEAGDEVSTIVAKSLSKDASRRYQSAGELARDIRHYLAGEPIEAKGDSAWYTVKKTLRRYRLAAAAGSAFVVVLVAALVVSLYLGNRARTESARARAVNEFMLGMLGSVDPDKEGPTVRVVEVLDRAAETVDARYAGQDVLRDEIHQTLGSMYLKLGEYAKAQAQSQACVDIRRAAQGPDAPETLSAISDVGLALTKAGDPKAAEPVLRQVLESQRRFLGPYHQNTLATLTNLAQTVRFLGRPQETISLYEEALPGAKRAFGPDEDVVLSITSNLAMAYDDAGRFKDAERLYRQVLERRTAVWGEEYSETMLVQNNLATLLLKQNRLTEAEPIFLAHLALLTKHLGADHVDVLTAKHNLSKLLQDEGKLDEALPMMRETLAARERILGESHPHTLATMANLGALLGKMKQFDEAVEVDRRALELRLGKLGPDHLDTIISKNNLAGTLREQGKLDEALALFREVVVTTDRTLPAGHYANALFRGNLGYTLLKAGKLDEAEPELLRAHAELVKVFGAAHPQTRQITKNLVTLYESQGKPDQATPFKAELEPPAPPAPAPTASPGP